jgi:hypothetical protein
MWSYLVLSVLHARKYNNVPDKPRHCWLCSLLCLLKCVGRKHVYCNCLSEVLWSDDLADKRISNIHIHRHLPASINQSRLIRISHCPLEKSKSVQCQLLD